jgi:hypothetical protein
LGVSEPMSVFVLFFGGYQATLLDIKAWKASAANQKPNVAFEGYPYPQGASWDGAEAVKAFTKAHDYEAAIKKIEGSGSDRIYIVGHSSGCAVANAVDAGLKNHAKITLVALDGYAPSNAQLARPTTQVWVAESSGGTSLHYSDLINATRGKARLNTYQAPSNCTTKLALHFSLVNESSSDALVHQIPQGYTACKANLSWLGYLPQASRTLHGHFHTRK